MITYKRILRILEYFERVSIWALNVAIELYPVGPFDAENIAEAVLLYVSTIPFPPSLLLQMCYFKDI